MNDQRDTELDGVAAQATQWFARMRESELSVDDRARFDRWIAESPVHVREYLGAAELWGAMQASSDWSSESTEELLALARASANVVSFPAQVAGGNDSRQRARPRNSVHFAVAATVLLILGVTCIAWISGNWFGRDRFATSLGEQRSVVLSRF